MLQQFKKWIRNNFGFSKVETNGFLLVLLVMVLSIILPFFYRSISSGPTIDPNDQLLLDSLVAQLEATPIKVQKIPKDSLFVFNPNTAKLNELKMLGLSNFISTNIIKYRESGGVFNYKENLTKIYGMNDSIFQSINSFIDLPDRPQANHQSRNFEGDLASQSKTLPQPSEEPEIVFDINLADTVDLKKINGIGSVLSNRVIKYRNLLGGFHSKDQYFEVYNLDPEVITKLANHTKISTDNCCKKLKISSMGIQELMRHPYLNRAQAQAIVAYRKQHGNFESFDDLKEIHLLDPDTFTRIYPYLEL
ncbi:MAG: helix-hairpin-helix domain-containing protein [Cyclobacteriaceae bacterium]